MPKFSQKSQEKLKTCDILLQNICNEAIKYVDFAIIEGHRTKEKQNEYFKLGKSQLQFPNSKHNDYPSMAVDVVPYVIGKGAIWDNDMLWNRVAFHMYRAADKFDTPIEWGGTWKNFTDKPHFELKE